MLESIELIRLELIHDTFESKESTLRGHDLEDHVDERSCKHRRRISAVQVREKATMSEPARREKFDYNPKTVVQMEEDAVIVTNIPVPSVEYHTTTL